ncbi:MAG: PQQ-dependent sugar dehydrogenase [Bacteroidota bacterium]|nr:PQQ-dependent sugar dehydrogenase [Bacteroidota bacterium]
MNAPSFLKSWKNWLLFLPGYIIFFVVCIYTREISAQGTRQDKSIILPKGFTAVIVADSIGEGRHIAVNSNGDIYISLARLKNGAGIVALRDVNNDGKADIIRYFGSFPGTGIGIYNGYLYFSSDTTVMRYKLIPGELLPKLKPEIIARGFKINRQHGAKSFTFDNDGYLYVNVGAPSNACQNPDRTLHTPGMNPCPLLLEFGGIWRFDANKTGQDQMKEGYRYATGLRNCVALRWNPVANHLYAVQHGRDQLHEFWPEYYSEDQGVNLPAEEFFLLRDGINCGWPYTYYDDSKNMKMLAPEYGGNGKIQDKTGSEKPIMAFPAHYAPNDLLFYTGDQFPPHYKNGAFIAFHGSWNRAPQEQKGYNVIFVPFLNDQPSGKWEVFADNFAGVSRIMSPRDAHHRPCGLAMGPNGSLYVVEDIQGRIWKITFRQ